MNCSLKLYVAVTWLVLCFAPNALSQSAGPAPEETPLCQLNAESIVDGSWFVSLDGWHVAYAMKVAGGQQAVIDGQKGPTYKQVYPPILNDDGSHYIYPAQVTEREWAMIWDGREHGRYSELFENGGWLSPDGRRVVYPAAKDNKLYLVTERGQIAQPHLSTPMCFSRDNLKLVYGAGDGKDGKYLVIDNKPSKTYDDIASFGPIANWTRFGWVAKQGKEYVYLVDTEEVGRGEQMTATITFEGGTLGGLDIQGGDIPVSGLNDWIVFTPDGLHYGFFFIRNEKHYLNVDGRVEEVEGMPKEFAFSADGSRYGYILEGEKSVVVVEDVGGGNRQQFGTFGQIRSLSVSSDGAHSAYIGMLKLGLMLVGSSFKVDDEIHYTGDLLGETSLSPDGRRFAVGAGKFAVIDGKEGPNYENLGPGGNMIPLETLLGGGEHSLKSNLCEPAGSGKVFFSPDSRHAVYIAQKVGRWVVVTDGVEGNPYDGILQQTFPRFEAGTLRYLALKGNTVYRVRQSLTH